MTGSVVIVGTGLIGTSLGLALSSIGVDVLLEDRDESARRRAAELGAGRIDPPEQPADVCFLAVPPPAIAPTLLHAQERGLASTYSDLASVKVGPLRAAAALGCDTASFVGGHPLAGSERSGPDAARLELFRGRPWVLIPPPAGEDVHFHRIRSLVERLGAKSVTMAADDHDRAVALISHGPHVLASLAAAQLADAPEMHVGISGQGLGDVTRIAASDPLLWAAILTGNAGPVAEVLRAVRDDLTQVLDALDALATDPKTEAAPEHGKHIIRLLTAANAGRARISVAS